MIRLKRHFIEILSDLKQFSLEFFAFISHYLRLQFIRFEAIKNFFVVSLYRQRGKLARRLIHSGMAGITAFGVMVAPIVAQEFPQTEVDPWDAPSPSSVLGASIDNSSTSTMVSEKMRDRILEYTVSQGDTVSTIAEKFGVSEDTIRWQNDLSRDTIKVGDILEILPITGISHKVQKGDTVYSIAKKYDSSAQAIVDFPYNTFVNDETFELAVGQSVIVPDGVKPEAVKTHSTPSWRSITPDAGSVVASGTYVWPASGRITQRYSWFHKAIDIANASAPNILAADSGTVIVAGWLDNYGYGNRVVIDHGNGSKTLYAHMQSIFVKTGQTVARGDVLGRMGDTGRSTGTHLHFEIIKNGVYLDPLAVLQ